jgi:hypothetical protein
MANTYLRPYMGRRTDKTTIPILPKIPYFWKSAIGQETHKIVHFLYHLG